MWYCWRARARGATISQNADGWLPGGEGHGCSPHTKRGSLGWEVGQTARFGGHLPPGLAGRQALKLGLDNESPSSPAERMDKPRVSLSLSPSCFPCPAPPGGLAGPGLVCPALAETWATLMAQVPLGPGTPTSALLHGLVFQPDRSRQPHTSPLPFRHGGLGREALTGLAGGSQEPGVDSRLEKAAPEPWRSRAAGTEVGTDALRLTCDPAP